MLRHENGAYYLLRLAIRPASPAPERQAARSSPLLDVITALPDGFVVIDENRKILMANIAFLDLAQLASEEQARGEQIERWLGRVDVDVDVLIANLREYGFGSPLPHDSARRIRRPRGNRGFGRRGAGAIRPATA